MEGLLFLFKGIGAGVIVAMPVGPVAVMCIRRTLANGITSGFSNGLGAAVADTLYAIIAAYGISIISEFLLSNDFWFRLIGGFILCIIAARMIGGAQKEGKIRDTGKLFGGFVTAFVITATNPITIVAFGVIFTSIGVATAAQSYEWAESLVLGVFIGSALWWGFLTMIAVICRQSMGTMSLIWISRVSSAIILACGLLLIFAAIAPESFIGELIELPEPG